MRELVQFIDRYGLQDGKGKKVLEIGAGDTVEFKSYFESLGYQYMAIDRDSKYKSSSCVIGDMADLSIFDNNDFFIVFSCHSFEHTELPINTLKEMRRVTQKYIFIATPYPCFHQILNADNDHIMVLTDMQMERLFRYCKIYKINIYYDKAQKIEQDYNVISIGEKES